MSDINIEMVVWCFLQAIVFVMATVLLALIVGVMAMGLLL